MARDFNGTTDKCTITTAPLLGSFLHVVPGTPDSGLRYSHPVPFRLANGDLLLGFCLNSLGDTAHFEWFCQRSEDDGLTFEDSPVNISGDFSFEGCFAQLSGGTVVCAYAKSGALAMRTSTDSGATWSSETVLDATAASGCHPSMILNGTRLTIAYEDNNSSVVVIHATVTSSAVGSFGSPVTVTASSDEPNVIIAPDGEMLVAYGRASGARCKRSTDGGLGNTFGSESTIGTASNDANLLLDGVYVWCFYPTGSLGSEVLNASISLDSGATWPASGVVIEATANDSHRTNAILVDGVPVVFCAAIEDDTDYHINRNTLDTQSIANMRGGFRIRSINNLQQWTAIGWIKDFVNNASNNNYILNKSAAPGTNIDRMFLGAFNNNRLFGQVGRSSSATLYFTGDNAFDPSVWTFIATNFDNSRGDDNRIKFYVGTTPANLAEVASATTTEGSGTIRDDTAGSACIAGRTSDNLRGYNGQIGKIKLIGSVLSLAEIRDIMQGASLATPPLVLDIPLDADAEDDSANGNDGTYSGTSAAGDEPPEFTPPVLTSIDPSSGPATGGTLVTLTGSDFVDGATVTFGGSSATSVTFVNSTTITCKTPAHAVGAVDVVVTNPEESIDTLEGAFTYLPVSAGSLRHQHRLRY